MNYCEHCRILLDWPRGDTPPRPTDEQCQMCGSHTRCHSHSDESLAQTRVIDCTDCTTARFLYVDPLSGCEEHGGNNWETVVTVGDVSMRDTHTPEEHQADAIDRRRRLVESHINVLRGALNHIVDVVNLTIEQRRSIAIAAAGMMEEPIHNLQEAMSEILPQVGVAGPEPVTTVRGEHETPWIFVDGHQHTHPNQGTGVRHAILSIAQWAPPGGHTVRAFCGVEDSHSPAHAIGTPTCQSCRAALDRTRQEQKKEAEAKELLRRPTAWERLSFEDEP